MKTELTIIAKNREQAIAKANSFGISIEIVAATQWGDERTYLAHTPVECRDGRIYRWFHERWDTQASRLDSFMPITQAA